MGIETILGGLASTLFSKLLGGGEKAAAAPEKDNRPDETSEGIAEARRRRRTLASRTGRSGLRSDSADSEGQTRGGLTIVT